ncbi:MAG: O-phosphoserine--tRNA ligase [Methanospirillaceae archaeon]|nr:O-phosphoserine--tRNA ligase [Methanospirillaceae archaeon]
MKFDADEYKKLARSDFEQAWHRGPEILSIPGREKQYPVYRYPRADPHPIFATIQRLRETYLMMGFSETENPIMVDEKEVYKQFGSEAMAVLDRVFYLGGLPRPNVGIGKEQVRKIEKITGTVIDEATEEVLRETLHAYKKAEIDGDELTHAISEVLAIDDAKVIEILDQVFPEFRELRPESSRITLRSHMTSGWFATLGNIWDKTPHPIRLFSVDRCFRREQAEDAKRLMSYHSASCIIADEEVTLDDGKAVSYSLLSAFGYTDFSFRPDEKRSKYYMPGTQTEVYARHPVHGWVEVATFGLYSPSALAEYGVGIPVMNLGLGVERLAMIAYGADDIRVLCHPQFYHKHYSDPELARAVLLLREPQTQAGRMMAGAIVSTAKAHATDPGPCSFTAWEGIIGDVSVKVFVLEPEENAKLCGPACFNDIYVHNGSILGVPDTEKFTLVREEGVATGISYLDAVAARAAHDIEQAAFCGRDARFQIKIARLPGDINLNIEDHAMRFITDSSQKIDVRGPVFLTVRSECTKAHIDEKS